MVVVCPCTARHLDRMRQPEARKLGLDIWGLGVALYAPTASGAYVYGHDGSNSPAINTSMRINPDNGDALIVLVTGNPTLASAIGAEWTIWQTGRRRLPLGQPRRAFGDRAVGTRALQRCSCSGDGAWCVAVVRRDRRMHRDAPSARRHLRLHQPEVAEIEAHRGRYRRSTGSPRADGRRSASPFTLNDVLSIAYSPVRSPKALISA